MAFAHNKRRNSALLFEFLVRHISKCLLENKKDEAGRTLALSKKYFGEGSPLKTELALFNAVTKTSVSSRESANKIIKIVRESASKMDARKLNEAKSRLIKEINYAFGQEVYSHKVPNYTVYASIQVLLNESRNKKKDLQEVDRIKLEDNICTFLTTEKKPAPGPAKVNPEINSAVYKFANERFNKKYHGKLSEAQRKLLSKYTTYLISKKDQEIKEYINTQIGKIKNKLLFVKDDEIRKDGDLTGKLREAAKKFDSLSAQTIDDKVVLEVLRYMQLVDEMES